MKNLAPLIFLMLLTLVGCATRDDIAPGLAEDAGWRWKILPGQSFDLATATDPWRRGSTLWVYLEGDGRISLSPLETSSDPTPDDPIALRLALAQPGTDPIAYIARPCQYVEDVHMHVCQADDWSSGRYAPKVVSALNDAVNMLKMWSNAQHVVLVGYSGGGALAVLMAAQRKDVKRIITVAANLDLAYWTKRDALRPLTGSLDPADAAVAVSKIPQVHFTGGQDSVVGTDVTRAYASHLPVNAPMRIIEVPNFTHTCCWVDQWGQLMLQASH